MDTGIGTVARKAGSRIVALALGVAAASTGLAADRAEFEKAAGEFSLVLAVMPVELIAGPQPPPERGATLFQPPAARDTHHVMVSIFQQRTGRRLLDVEVAARVAALGVSGEKKRLEPTVVAGAPVFANVFPMLGRGPFRVDVEFSVAGDSRPERATFYFTHPSFAFPEGASREGQRR